MVLIVTKKDYCYCYKHLTRVSLERVVRVLVSSGERASPSLSVLELSLRYSQCKFAGLRLV